MFACEETRNRKKSTILVIRKARKNSHIRAFPLPTSPPPSAILLRPSTINPPGGFSITFSLIYFAGTTNFANN